jgi:hypothetical protein
MRRTIAVVTVLCLAGAGWAQERLPQEQATKLARHFAEEASKVSSPQLKTEVDAEKAFALHAGEAGVMFIPEKGLSADAFAKAGAEPTPLGQLWMRNLVPTVQGKPVPEDKLRLLTVRVKDEDHHLPLSLAGVRKASNNQLELVLYGKDREPYLHAPVRKLETKQKSDEPVVLEAQKDAGDSVTITLTMAGEYQASIQVMKAEK